MRNTMKSMACGLLAIGITGTAAHANVVYTWRTLSATLNGLPTSLTAQGEITMTDAGFSRGSGSVRSFLPGNTLQPTQTLDGIASASFQMFGGPIHSTPNSLINFSAFVHGPDLIIDALNLLANGGGFFVDANDTEAYWGSPGPGFALTVSYGTDNSFSPCYGPQTLPGSHCIVTGVFEDPDQVPEPATWTLLGVGLLGLLTIASSRRP